MPRVSVIMGVYNIGCVPVFDQAMHSILNQSYHDFEFIICNDGSVDNTDIILKKYAQMDARVQVIHNEKNCGLAAALNRCLDLAMGDFIARQDADDISSLNRLQKQVEFLTAHLDIGFVGTNVRLYDETGVWGRRVLPEYPERRNFLFTTPFVHGTMMFRKNILRTVDGYRIAKETRRAEDYDLQMRLYAKGYYGANIQEFLYDFCEDKQTARRRKYRYRIDEVKIRWKGFRMLGLLPAALPFVIKPMIVGLIPSQVLLRMKDGHTIQRNK